MAPDNNKPWVKGLSNFQRGTELAQSPFSGPLVELVFRDNVTLRIHADILSRSPRLIDLPQGDPLAITWTSRDLSSISSTAGHIIVNYLYTYKLEGLGWTSHAADPEEQAARLKTCFEVYAAARKYELDGLQDLAKRHINDHGGSQDLLSFIDIVEDVYPEPLGDDAWFPTYIKERIKTAFQHPEFALTAASPSGFGDKASMLKILLQGALEAHKDIIDALRAQPEAVDSPLTPVTDSSFEEIVDRLDLDLDGSVDSLGPENDEFLMPSQKSVSFEDGASAEPEPVTAAELDVPMDVSEEPAPAPVGSVTRLQEPSSILEEPVPVSGEPASLAEVPDHSNNTLSSKWLAEHVFTVECWVCKRRWLGVNEKEINPGRDAVKLPGMCQRCRNRSNRSNRSRREPEPAPKQQVEQTPANMYPDECIPVYGEPEAEPVPVYEEPEAEPALELEPVPEAEPEPALETKEEHDGWGFPVRTKKGKKKAKAVEPEVPPEVDPEVPPEVDPEVPPEVDPQNEWGVCPVKPKKDKKKKRKGLKSPSEPEPHLAAPEEPVSDLAPEFDPPLSQPQQSFGGGGLFSHTHQFGSSGVTSVTTKLDTQPAQRPLFGSQAAARPLVFGETKPAQQPEEPQQDPWSFWGAKKSPRSSLGA